MEIGRILVRLAAAVVVVVGQMAIAGFTSHGDAALAHLLAEALTRNPAIKAAAASHAAATELAAQAGSLADPMLSLTGHALPPQTRVGPQIAGVSVTQAVPWFGERNDRRETADAQAAASRELMRAESADVVRAVKRTYYELAYLDAAMGIAAEEVELLRHYESLARARYAEGAGLQSAVVKLQAAITKTLHRLAGLRGQRAAAEAELNALLDRPAHHGIPPVEIGNRPALAVAEEPLRSLASAGGARSPEVRLAALGIQRAEVEVRIAKRRHRPEVALTATWGIVGERSDGPGRLNPPPGNGDDVFSIGVGLRVPIYRAKLAAGVREAEARLLAAREAHRSALTRLDLTVRSAQVQLAAIDEQIGLYENALLPQTEHALAATEAAYASGTTGTHDLLDDEQELLEARQSVARLRADYMQLLADVERAIGSAFPPGPSTPSGSES